MYCKKCGKELKKADKFCTSCGQGKDEIVTQENIVVNAHNKDASLCLGFGIGCLVASLFISILCLPFGIISIVYYIKSKKKTGEGSAGLGLSIAGIIIGIITLIFWIWLIKFFINLIDTETNNYQNKTYEKYDNNYNDKFNTTKDGKLVNMSVAEWMISTSNSEQMVTVLTNNDCRSCGDYLDEVEDVADEMNIEIVWFNIDNLSETDKFILETYDNIKRNNVYPYTFVTSSSSVVAEYKGYIGENTLERKLIELGIGNSKYSY